MCNIHSNDNYLLRMRFISLSTIPVRKEYLAKINNLPNHHGAEPPEARGPMQSHRLKAGPVCASHPSAALRNILNTTARISLCLVRGYF